MGNNSQPGNYFCLPAILKLLARTESAAASIVDYMVEFILRKLREGWDVLDYRWSAMLSPSEKTVGE